MNVDIGRFYKYFFKSFLGDLKFHENETLNRELTFSWINEHDYLKQQYQAERRGFAVAPIHSSLS